MERDREGKKKMILDMVVERIEQDEKGKRGKFKLVLKCGLGEYAINVGKKTAQQYLPGTLLFGEIASVMSNLPDFVGGKVEEQTIGTASYELVILKDAAGKCLYRYKINKRLSKIKKTKRGNYG